MSAASVVESEKSEEPARAIDLSGLLCPLPVLRTKKALSEMRGGDLLRIYATDPGAREDIPAFARQSGHTLENTRGDENGCYFWLRRRG